MDYRMKLEKLIAEKNGLVLTKDLVREGIPRQYLSLFTKEELLERVAPGVYVDQETFEDELYYLQARNTRIVFSHETALFIHDLTDRDPIHYSVTIPAGYNGSNLRKAGIKVYSVKKELYEAGIIEAQTSFGRKIRIYDMERTICDIVRSRSKIDNSIMTDALKRYSKRSDKSISLLLHYGESFGISNRLREYMEVLL